MLEYWDAGMFTRLNRGLPVNWKNVNRTGLWGVQLGWNEKNAGLLDEKSGFSMLLKILKD
jgi:hypothetical protein